MTTCVYSAPHGTAAADTQNTDSASMRWRVNKLEPCGKRLFMGSGHCRTIATAKLWASKLDKNGDPFNPASEPDWSYFLEDEEERDFACLLIDPDGRVWMIDGELTPMLVHGDFFAVGSGASYALGALEAGASPVKAVEIAAKYDVSTSAPIDSITLKEMP